MHNLKRKLDRLCRRLRHRMHRRDDRTPFLSQYSSSGSDGSYRPRSRTPPSESFTSSSWHTLGRKHCSEKLATLQRGKGDWGLDTMGKALLQISHSPFSRRIEQAKLPFCFNQPTFTIYNGKANLVKHVSHFNQRMAIHSKNKALMCKVFLSSLGLMAMRWFDNLAKGSIHSYKELTRAFGARFLT